MIHLRLRTEYSFRRAYGKVEEVLARAEGTAAGITDGGTWGHVPWAKAAKKHKVKPLFGAECMVVRDATKRERQHGPMMAFLARSGDGLRELYRMMTWANCEGYYYWPRLDYNMVNALSEEVYVLSGAGPIVELLKPKTNLYLELNPSNPAWNRLRRHYKMHNWVVCADNAYVRPEDRSAYEVLAADNRRTRTGILHIPDEDELRLAIPEATDDDFLNAERIAADCDCVLPEAVMLRFPDPTPLYELCMRGALDRGMPVGLTEDRRNVLLDSTYQARLERELALIKEKQFEDYFYVITDMVERARKEMLVGPARGSSAGSLVCYLLGITDVDPIKHDLMFERFIDVTRADLPDVDIDFPDDRREIVLRQLGEKYGSERVGRLGTVMRYKAKSALTDVSKQLRIPVWEVQDVKNAVIERSTGDARAQFCIQDAFDSLEIGRALLTKYPQLRVAALLEGHARQSGTHAAGLVVTEHPLSHYGTIDHSGVIQLDKRDAERLNLLKIDALGLRTLAVIQDCLDQIGKDRHWLLAYPLDDVEAFEVFNTERYAGIFQYEGYALQNLTRQMKIREFNDVAVITALARPGPLHCGAADEFINRRVGREPVTYLHPLAEPCTRDTYGSVIYQEQVMAIGRAIGQLSWEEVSELRKAMSKSLGEEFFNRYWEKFKAGASQQGIVEGEARRIWDKMCTFGSWAFNKSHAVSYGLLSYWCAVLKAHYPMQWAAACLRNSKDEGQSRKILQELVLAGFSYKPVDPDQSGVSWGVVDGTLVGGLTNIRGVGEAKAKDILARRKARKPLLPGQMKLMTDPKTPFDDLFEGERKWGDIYKNPKAHKIETATPILIKDIQDNGTYIFIAKLKEKNLRDLNEYGNVAKRGGRLIKKNNLFLNLVLEDDSGFIFATISRWDYRKLGKPIIEKGKVGDWYLWKGEIRNNWRKVYVSQVRLLGS